MANLIHPIIEACKKQDSRAQMHFYKTYYKMVYNCCLRILSNTAEAEDCMQESFLKAFEKIETIKDAPLEAWLRRIAINTAIDKLRNKQIEIIELNEQIQVPIEEYSDEEEIEWKVEQIKRTIGMLPDNHRVILSLHLFEGYDYEEIAEILKSKTTTIRAQFSRARQKLIEKIKEEKVICV